MWRLTTHVLDTASGKPANAMPLRLMRVHEDESRTEIARTITNRDGRTDAPLLEGPALKTGTYELIFTVREYFEKTASTLADPPFLDIITLRFSVAQEEAHYHVPLLVSPWSYSTYRGS